MGQRKISFVAATHAGGVGWRSFFGTDASGTYLSGNKDIGSGLVEGFNGTPTGIQFFFTDPAVGLMNIAQFAAYLRGKIVSIEVFGHKVLTRDIPIPSFSKSGSITSTTILDGLPSNPATDGVTYEAIIELASHNVQGVVNNTIDSSMGAPIIRTAI